MGSAIIDVIVALLFVLTVAYGAIKYPLPEAEVITVIILPTASVTGTPVAPDPMIEAIVAVAVNVPLAKLIVTLLPE